MGTSSPPTWIAYCSAPLPIRSAATLAPSPRTLPPKPVPSAIWRVTATIASWFPQVSWMPPVSSSVMMPFS